MDAQRLAQIGIFIFGLSQVETALNSLWALAQYPAHMQLSGTLVAVGHVVFIGSLLFASGGWARLVGVPGSVSSLSGFSRHDLFLVAVSTLGLFLLVSGITDAVGEAVFWFQARSFSLAQGIGFAEPLLPKAVVPALRAAAGAALLVWGSSVGALVAWARGLGRGHGAA